MVKTQKSLTLVIIAILILAVFGYRWWVSAGQAPLVSNQLETKAKGNPNAPIHILEFFDFQCPSCAQSSIMISKYMKDHPDMIHLENKYYPLKNHSHAMVAATYAECARYQGKYWAMHDALFETQESWRELPDAEPTFKEIAKQGGLDMRRLAACIDQPQVASAILEDKDEGTAMQIRMTPTFFVNGKMVVGSKGLEAALDNYLSKSQAAE
jgi:protein-disulfide isomerase